MNKTTAERLPYNVAHRPADCHKKAGIMLFYSFFKTLVGKPVCVELKNDLSLTGTLESVDQYLNVKLSNVDVVDKERFPQLLACKDSFIRGSTIRYIQIPRNEVDTELLQDAARKETMS